MTDYWELCWRREDDDEEYYLETEYEAYLDRKYEQEKVNLLTLFFKFNKFPLLFNSETSEIIAELYYQVFFDELYVPNPNIGNYYSDDF
jgi:hypothetical protein